MRFSRTSLSQRRRQRSRTSRTSPSASCRATAFICCGLTAAAARSGAEEAKALGVTSEIVARDCIVHRARENRRAHCQTPSANRQLYPLAVTQKLRPIVDESVAFGPLPGGLPREIALEELEDDRANLMDVGFERKMAGVVEVQLGIHVVALECLGAGR